MDEERNEDELGPTEADLEEEDEMDEFEEGTGIEGEDESTEDEEEDAYDDPIDE